MVDISKAQALTTAWLTEVHLVPGTVSGTFEGCMGWLMTIYCSVPYQELKII